MLENLAFGLRVLREIQNITGFSTGCKDDSAGTLSVGTTHTQARYVLLPVIKEFRWKPGEEVIIIPRSAMRTRSRGLPGRGGRSSPACG